MARSIAQPPDTADAFNTAGDTIIGGRTPTPDFYEQLARQQSGLAPIGAKQVAPPSAAPSGPALPAPGVARQVLNRHVQQLRAEAASGRREVEGRFVFTAAGFQVSDPVQLSMRAELVAQVEAAEAEADRLQGLDDLACREWARDRGIR